MKKIFYKLHDIQLLEEIIKHMVFFTFSMSRVCHNGVHKILHEFRSELVTVKMWGGFFLDGGGGKAHLFVFCYRKSERK